MEYSPGRHYLGEILSLLEASGAVVDVSVSTPTIEAVVKRLRQGPHGQPPDGLISREPAR